MSDTFIPKMTDIQAGMENPKVATLNKEFLISKDALYDYYSTNSGMIAKNPSIGGAGGGGGGGGSGGDLSGRVANLENEVNAIQGQQITQNTAISNNASAINTIQDRQNSLSVAAQESLYNLRGFVESDNLSDVQQIIDNQVLLRDSQENLYQAAISSTI